MQIPKTTYLTAFGVLVIMSYFVLTAIVLEVLLVYYLTELVRNCVFYINTRDIISRNQSIPPCLSSTECGAGEWKDV